MEIPKKPMPGILLCKSPAGNVYSVYVCIFWHAGGFLGKYARQVSHAHYTVCTFYILNDGKQCTQHFLPTKHS